MTRSTNATAHESIDEKSPFDMSWDAQEAVISVERLLTTIRYFVILGIFAPVTVLMVSPHPQKLMHAFVALLVFSFLFLFILLPVRLRCQKARKSVNQLFLYHRSKAHETCGSMDPHLTQAR